MDTGSARAGEEFALQGQSKAYASLSAVEASVVLPTYNRADCLDRVLRSLEQQTAPSSGYEVIAIDDGSTDSTAEVLAAYAERTDCVFRFACLSTNGGPARARNHALRMARGEVVVITGDDVVATADFVAMHLQWHRDHPAETDALLGRVTWPEELDVSPFMKWMEKGGRQFFFNYADLEPGKPADGSSFYTANVSLKRAFLFRTDLFDETFPYASHEDLELGHRLHELGMKLYFDPSVLGYHWHPLALEAIARRVYLMGYSAHLYWEKVRDDSATWKKVLRRLLVRMVALPVFPLLWRAAVLHSVREGKEYPLLWKVILVLSYWIGLSDAARGKPVRPLP